MWKIVFDKYNDFYLFRSPTAMKHATRRLGKYALVKFGNYALPMLLLSILTLIKWFLLLLQYHVARLFALMADADYFLPNWPPPEVTWTKLRIQKTRFMLKSRLNKMARILNFNSFNSLSHITHSFLSFPFLFFNLIIISLCFALSFASSAVAPLKECLDSCIRDRHSFHGVISNLVLILCLTGALMILGLVQELLQCIILG